MKRVRCAFTLIELLVVVSIIALLVSILVPALGKAREQARRAVCAVQMKQHTIALVSYATTNVDYLPLVNKVVGDGNLGPFTGALNEIPSGIFDYILKKQMGKTYEIFLCPSNPNPLRRQTEGKIRFLTYHLWPWKNLDNFQTDRGWAKSDYFWLLYYTKTRRPNPANNWENRRYASFPSGSPNYIYGGRPLQTPPVVPYDEAYPYPEGADIFSLKTNRRFPASVPLLTDIVWYQNRDGDADDYYNPGNPWNFSPENPTPNPIACAPFYTNHLNQAKDLPWGGNVMFMDGHIVWVRYEDMGVRHFMGDAAGTLASKW